MFILHNVKCLYCQHNFDADIEPYVKVGRRYSHAECSEKYAAQQTQEELDKQALDLYIMNLFDTDYVEPRTKALIKTYINTYHYTYAGILKALKYWYEVKKNTTEKSNGSIGIVQYIYNESQKYFLALWNAQQQNKNKDMNEYKPKDVLIKIKSPERKIKKKNKFSILEDEDYGEQE